LCIGIENRGGISYTIRIVSVERELVKRILLSSNTLWHTTFYFLFSVRVEQKSIIVFHIPRAKSFLPSRLVLLSDINSRGLREGVKKKHNNRTVG
jgi:hypothetical protein